MKIKFKPKQVEMGKKVEKEHWTTVKGDMEMIMGIVRDHLKEDPNYYTKLNKMEGKSDAMDIKKERK